MAAQRVMSIWADRQKPIDVLGVIVLLVGIAALVAAAAYYAVEGWLWALSPKAGASGASGGWTQALESRPITRTLALISVTGAVTTAAARRGSGFATRLSALALWAALAWGLALGVGVTALRIAGQAAAGGWPGVLIPAATGVATCIAAGVAIGLVIRWLVDARRHIESYQKRSISEGASALLLIVLLGGPPLAAWASGHMSGEEGRRIEPAIGILTVAVISLVLIAAGWVDVLRRNAPRFSRISQSFYTVRIVAGTVGGVLNIASYLFSFVDWLFAVLLSKASGVTLKNAFARYVVLLAQLAACGVILWYAHSPWALLAPAWIFLISLGIARRWAWLEDDRERYLSVKQDEVSARSGIQIGFVDDLRDEALTSFTILFFVLLPLTLRAANQHFDMFVVDQTAVSGPGGYIDWLGYLGGELAKAAPLIDWSEVYGVSNKSPIEPREGIGQHVVFVLRASMDVLLLAGLIQAFSISARLARERTQFDYPGDDLNLLDPFEERAELAAAAVDWTRVGSLSNYDAGRLAKVLNDRTDASATGAARLAGFQLADEAIKTLMRPKPRVAYSGAAWRALQVEALEGLRRRRDLIPSEARRRRFDPVIAHLESPPPENAVLTPVVGALAKLARMRDLETLVLKVAKAAPEIQKEALAQLKKCTPEDAADLIDMLQAPREELVIAAIDVLGDLHARIDPGHMRETTAAIAALMERGKGYTYWQIRRAAATALGKLGGEEALAALQIGIEDSNPEVRAAAEAALAGMDDARSDAILKDGARRSRPTILGELGDAARSIGPAPHRAETARRPPP